jgi:two-component system sensor histidine kinase/response regulator
LPKAVVGDPGRLRQIIVNLLGNSVKFTEAGEIALRVAEVSRDSKSITLQFSVSDTGIGISQEWKERSTADCAAPGDSVVRQRAPGRSGALIPFEVGQCSAAMWGRVPAGRALFRL